MIKCPIDLIWIDGDLPDVGLVSYDFWALAWFVYDENPSGTKRNEDNSYSPVKRPDLAGKFKKIAMVHPHGDNLNPVRWCDSSGHPIGYEEEVKHFAWIKLAEPING